VGVIGPDGDLRVDVRAQIETGDGAFLYMQYFGLLEMNAAVQNAIENGTGTEFADQVLDLPEDGDRRSAQRTACSGRPFSSVRAAFCPGLAIEYRVWRPA